ISTVSSSSSSTFSCSPSSFVPSSISSTLSPKPPTTLTNKNITNIATKAIAPYLTNGFFNNPCSFSFFLGFSTSLDIGSITSFSSSTSSLSTSSKPNATSTDVTFFGFLAFLNIDGNPFNCLYTLSVNHSLAISSTLVLRIILKYCS